MAKLRFYQRQHSDRQQRVSAQIEEARVPAYPVQAQDAGPDTGKFLLHRANWRFVSVQAIGAAIRRGQGLAIQFAIVREGHAIEADISSRYHVFGQTCQEMRPQCFRPDVRASRIVGSQTLVPRAVLTCDDADLTDALALRQPGLSPASSMRYPRILTWKSLRPRYSIMPSAVHRPRSPVLYMRAPGSAENGLATNRSAVRSGRFK